MKYREFKNKNALQLKINIQIIYYKINLPVSTVIDG